MYLPNKAYKYESKDELISINQTIGKKFCKEMQKKSNFLKIDKEKLLSWFFNFNLEDRKSIVSVDNQWLSIIITKLYSIYQSKKNITFGFLREETHKCEYDIYKDVSKNKNNFNTFQKIFFNNSDTLENIESIYLPAEYNIYAQAIKKGELYTYNRDKTQYEAMLISEILMLNFNDAEIMTLGNKLLDNKTEFTTLFNAVSDKGFLTKSIECKLDSSNKMYSFSFPTWLKDNFSLAEFIAASIEQILQLKYVLYQLYKPQFCEKTLSFAGQEKALTDFFVSSNLKEYKIQKKLIVNFIEKELVSDAFKPRIAYNSSYTNEISERKKIYFKNEIPVKKLVDQLQEYTRKHNNIREEDYDIEKCFNFSNDWTDYDKKYVNLFSTQDSSNFIDELSFWHLPSQKSFEQILSKNIIQSIIELCAKKSANDLLFEFEEEISTKIKDKKKKAKSKKVKDLKTIGIKDELNSDASESVKISPQVFTNVKAFPFIMKKNLSEEAKIEDVSNNEQQMKVTFDAHGSESEKEVSKSLEKLKMEICLNEVKESSTINSSKADGNVVVKNLLELIIDTVISQNKNPNLKKEEKEEVISNDLNSSFCSAISKTKSSNSSIKGPRYFSDLQTSNFNVSISNNKDEIKPSNESFTCIGSEKIQLNNPSNYFYPQDFYPNYIPNGFNRIPIYYNNTQKHKSFSNSSYIRFKDSNSKQIDMSHYKNHFGSQVYSNQNYGETKFDTFNSFLNQIRPSYPETITMQESYYNTRDPKEFNELAQHQKGFNSKATTYYNNGYSKIYNFQMFNNQTNEEVFLNKLHSEILDHINRLKQMIEKIKPIKLELIELIKKTIEQKFAYCSIDIYGSFASDLSIEYSDIDLAIYLNSDTSIPNAIYELSNLFRLNKGFTNINPIPTATVPVIKLECNPLKLVEQNSKYAFYEYLDEIKDLNKGNPQDEVSKIKFDLTFIEMNPTFKKCDQAKSSVQFIKDYKQLYPEITPLILILKRFLQIYKLNSYFNGKH